MKPGAFAVLLLFTMANAGSENLKPSEVQLHWDAEGTYTGTLYTGYDIPVVTTFFYQGEDLIGEYVMDENGTMTPGQLINITFVSAHTIECRWVDVYGTGPASFTFADDFAGFTGWWGTDEGLEEYNWWGARNPAVPQTTERQ